MVEQLALFAGGDAAGIELAQDLFALHAIEFAANRQLTFEHHIMFFNLRALERSMSTGQQLRHAQPQRLARASFLALQAQTAHIGVVGWKIRRRILDSGQVHSASITLSLLPDMTFL